MKAKRLKIYLIFIGALLFNWFFGKEKMAVNALAYSLFSLIVLFSLYPTARHSSTVRWLLTGHLICLALIKKRQKSIKQIRDMFNSVPANYDWMIHEQGFQLFIFKH